MQLMQATNIRQVLDMMKWEANNIVCVVHISTLLYLAFSTFNGWSNTLIQPAPSTFVGRSRILVHLVLIPPIVLPKTLLNHSFFFFMLFPSIEWFSFKIFLINLLLTKVLYTKSALSRVTQIELSIEFGFDKGSTESKGSIEVRLSAAHPSMTRVHTSKGWVLFWARESGFRGPGHVGVWV